jgi:3-methyladenine DNA glycosylase AlkC
VERNGIEEKYLGISLQTIEEITKRFSMEYSIRKFINNHEEKTLEKIILWSKSGNYHVRRLSSE